MDVEVEVYAATKGPLYHEDEVIDLLDEIARELMANGSALAAMGDKREGRARECGGWVVRDAVSIMRMNRHHRPLLERLNGLRRVIETNGTVVR